MCTIFCFSHATLFYALFQNGNNHYVKIIHSLLSFISIIWSVFSDVKYDLDPYQTRLFREKLSPFGVFSPNFSVHVIIVVLKSFWPSLIYLKKKRIRHLN